MASTTGMLCYALLAFAPAPCGAAGEVSVHGFLTQGIAATDGHQLLGIPKNGTTDYRNVAVQFRYAPAPGTAFALQLYHQRLGLSPSGGDELELDWAFVSHHLGESAEIRVGKVPLPLGIYNEVRDVGTLLPFYRPPTSVYREASWTSEAVDGIVLSAVNPSSGAWSLSFDAFAGGWNMAEQSGTATAAARVDRAIGAQVWLHTPVRTLRVGLHGERTHVSPSALGLVSGPVTFLMASLDADVGFLSADTEYFDVQFGGGRYRAMYSRLGLDLTRGIAVHGQVEGSWGRVTLPTPSGPALLDRELNRDLALGIGWKLREDVLLKAEMHRARGFDNEDTPRNPFTDSPVRTRYFIVSASASF